MEAMLSTLHQHEGRSRSLKEPSPSRWQTNERERATTENWSEQEVTDEGMRSMGVDKHKQLRPRHYEAGNKPREHPTTYEPLLHQPPRRWSSTSEDSDASGIEQAGTKRNIKWSTDMGQEDQHDESGSQRN
ncbi:hypothetical protein F444_16588, partial [Phytophthora nicotianae P1976]